MNENPRFRIQFTVKSLLIAITFFALGLSVRNLSLGLHPFATNFFLPSSKSPVTSGEILIVECETRPEFGRRVQVLSDGTITLKAIGTISVSGQNLSEIEKTVKSAYRTHFSDSTPDSIEVFRAVASQPLD